MGKFKRVFKFEKNILHTLGKMRDAVGHKVDSISEHHPHSHVLKALKKVKNIATSQHLLERGEHGIDHVERFVNHGHHNGNHGHNSHHRHNNTNQDY